MRHGKKGNHLGRKVGHRRALLANLAIALFTHKRINTTVAKAKALRVYAEPLITKAVKAAKTESAASATHQHRMVFSWLQNKEAVSELFGAIAQKVGDRPGGYLRIIKTGFRKGDGADMAMIELVDFNEIYNQKGGDDAAASKRTRRGGKKIQSTGTAPSVAAPVVAVAAPVVVEEEVVVVETREVEEAPVAAFEAAPVVAAAAAAVVVEEIVTQEVVTETIVETVHETIIETVAGEDKELAEANLDMSGWTVVSNPTDVDGEVPPTEMENNEEA
jgi:large subunit ribosomal protein L17